MAVGDAALGQVVRGELEGDAVSGKDSNAVAAQLTGKVREDGALLVELDAEEAAGEFFDDRSSYFDAVFFAHCPPGWEICTAFLLGSLTRNPRGEGVVDGLTGCTSVP